MKLSDFELEVIELAHEGVRLTIPNVVAETGVKPDKAEKWLDELCRNGKLDLEIDEDEAITYYRVIGLTVRKKKQGSGGDVSKALVPIGDSAVTAVAKQAALAKLGMDGEEKVSKSKKKRLLYGFLFGFFLPGVGLFYAAPWLAAIAATLLALVVWKVSAIPLVGWAVGAAYMITSGVAGIFYTNAYNKNGKRTHIHSKLKKQLPSG